MSLGERARRSAKRARAGQPAGLAGLAYRALSRGTSTVARAAVAVPAVAQRRESAHLWDVRSHDGHDEAELAELRAELDRELDRLTRPRDES